MSKSLFYRKNKELFRNSSCIALKDLRNERLCQKLTFHVKIYENYTLDKTFNVINKVRLTGLKCLVLTS